MKKLFLLWIVLAFPAFAHAENALYPIRFQSTGGVEKGAYLAELATTQTQQATGLMFRTHMPRNQGMVFFYPTPHQITMWMKNTRIPLDMVFVDVSHRVSHIHANAKPMDESLISSPEPVRFVIELNGGEAARIGLEKGDELILSKEAHHALFP